MQDFFLYKARKNNGFTRKKKDKNEEVGQTRNHANSLSSDPSGAINFK